MAEKIRGGAKVVLWMFLLIMAATGLGYVFRMARFPETNIVLLYIVAVLLTARFTSGYIWGMVASVACTFAYNFFFTFPYYSFSVADTSYIITFAGMTVAAILTGALTSREKMHAGQAQEREREVKALYALSSKLADADNLEKIVETASDKVGGTFRCGVDFIHYGDRRFETYASRLERLRPGEPLLPDAPEDVAECPVSGQEGWLGVIRLSGIAIESLPAGRRELLHSMIENIGMAVDRVRASEERYRDRELMEQERYRANLLRAISHDLRTPLTGIMGTSEMLMDMSGEQDPRRAMAREIYQDADWLHSLVENILGLTRLRDGRLPLGRTPEALEEIVASAVRRVEKREPGREIAVRIPEEYIEVRVDAKLIEQVIVNLLDNAVKHTKAAEEIRVTVERAEDGFVRVRVADRGEGIAPGDLPNLFQMFYTSEGRPTDARRGVGLGLSICETIVKAHGGSIRAANREDGPGAAFTFTLPAVCGPDA